MLLQAGADPAPDPQRGLTPLETALYHGSVAAAELLVQHTIAPLALWSAAGLGRLDLMETMVDQDGNLLPAATAGRPNLSDVGWPPAPPRGDDRQAILDEALAYAGINGRDTAIDWLLDRGAEVDGRPYLNVTPLHFAVQFGRSSTVQLLLPAAPIPVSVTTFAGAHRLDGPPTRAATSSPGSSTPIAPRRSPTSASRSAPASQCASGSRGASSG
ncbi:MAG TPA: ankyrin repeat domain-containing protein [Solirubrobacteraceae bacterium]